MLEAKDIKIKESGLHTGDGKTCGTYSHLMTFYSLILNAVVLNLGCMLKLPEQLQKMLMPRSHPRYSNLKYMGAASCYASCYANIQLPNLSHQQPYMALQKYQLLFLILGFQSCISFESQPLTLFFPLAVWFLGYEFTEIMIFQGLVYCVAAETPVYEYKSAENTTKQHENIGGKEILKRVYYIYFLQ